MSVLLLGNFVSTLLASTSATLIPIIKRFVRPGSIIFTDGWKPYKHLRQEGYTTFTVVHAAAFLQVYYNEGTSELVIVHTNTIEASWSHAKAHFRRINGEN